MVAPRIDTTEDLLARLTTAAYSVALRHGLKAPFIDVELALWDGLRAVLAEEMLGTCDLSVREPVNSEAAA